MNIAIDVSPTLTGHKARGIGVYTRELVEALQKYETKHTYRLIQHGQKIPDETDMIHYPYFDPFLLTLPVLKQKPVIVTVHDLIPIIFPDKFPKGVRGTIVWQTQKTSLRGSKRIITDSQNSRNDIRKIIGFDEHKIDVIPLAPLPIFKPVREKAIVSSVRRKYHLPKEYILYVGDVNWNKNISGLLEAFAAAVHGEKPIRSSLVLVGSAFLKGDLKEVIAINRLIETLNIQMLVIRPGFVPDADLVSIYTAATCFVQPSWYEGFGLPVLEAMASGCPVITSNAGSLTEIAGPAFCIEPDDIEGMASLMRQMGQNQHEKRTEIVRKGIVWASRFTWQKVARETVKSYERMVQ